MITKEALLDAMRVSFGGNISRDYDGSLSAFGHIDLEAFVSALNSCETVPTRYTVKHADDGETYFYEDKKGEFVRYDDVFPEPAAPVVAPLTLDDVTRHTDALCAEYRQRMVDHQAWYTERVGQLSTAIEASEDLNHMEAGYIFLTKIRELTAPPETVEPAPVPVAEWVDWSGGDRPIPGDTLVTVKLWPEGLEADGYARDIQWEDPSPIMAYRVNA